MIFNGQNAKKNQRKIPILDQWIEITIVDGKTVTELYPSNEELIEEGYKMDPPPELVYRRFFFPNGVPREYHFTTNDKNIRRYGGLGIQRMTPEKWLETIETERRAGTGHLGRIRGGNLPRPKERGMCDCPFCTACYEREKLAHDAIVRPPSEPLP